MFFSSFIRRKTILIIIIIITIIIIIIIIIVQLYSCFPFLQIIDEILKSDDERLSTKKVSFKIKDELDQLDDTLTEALKLNMRITHNDSQLRKRQQYRPHSILVRSTSPGAESLSPRASKWFIVIYL